MHALGHTYFDVMLHRPDQLHFISNEIILKIICADYTTLLY